MAKAASIRRLATIATGCGLALVLTLPAAAAVPRATLKGVDTDEARSAAKTYAELVRASYDSSIASAKTMQTAIGAFLAAPSDATLAAAKQAWLDARDDYSPTEAFRLYDGPIDDPETGLEGQINAWPLDEAYIDYVEGDAGAGIINDLDDYPEITTDVLTEANEKGGEENISTGWHAIEFLLWGQDLAEGVPGNRPVGDYTTSPTAARRSAYLQLATDLLVSDLETVRAEWEPGEPYPTKFVKNPRTAVRDILRGIGALSAGELAGERMAVAYDTKDQEDEHSCFSDNTNADILGNAIGIQRVYLSQFPDGSTGTTSISDLVKSVDPKLDRNLTDQMAESVSDIEAHPTTFELLLPGDDDMPGRVALLTSIESLEKQGKLIAKVANKFGVRVTLAV
jgi:putative iron-regulated protein